MDTKLLFENAKGGYRGLTDVRGVLGRSRLGAPGASTLPRTGVIMVAAAGALLCALVALHAAPVRALVLGQVAAAVRTSYGIDVRAGSLS